MAVKIPFSGRNPELTALGRKKPHLLILNKVDLCDLKLLQKDTLLANGLTDVLVTDCKSQFHPSVKEIMKKLKKINLEKNELLKVMVVGIPNVGKSSLINALRRNFLGKGKAVKVGGDPGITRNVSSYIKISNDPPVHLIDTPGILIPRISNGEVLMKLAAIGTLKDHLIGIPLIAEYILFVMNEQQKFKYVDVYNLDGPCLDFNRFLELISKRLHSYSKGGTLNTLKSASHFIKQFREGRLGKILLD